MKLTQKLKGWWKGRQYWEIGLISGLLILFLYYISIYFLLGSEYYSSDFPFWSIIFFGGGGMFFGLAIQEKKYGIAGAIIAIPIFFLIDMIMPKSFMQGFFTYWGNLFAELIVLVMKIFNISGENGIVVIAFFYFLSIILIGAFLGYIYGKFKKK